METDAGWSMGKEEDRDNQHQKDDESCWVLDSSVNHKGEVPLRAKTGVWRAALFILAIEFTERLSFFGLSTNLIIYLTKVLHQEVKVAAKNVNYWVGVTTLVPLLGGFIADSFLGRFNTVLVSSLIYLLGLGLLTLSQYVPSLKPCDSSAAAGDPSSCLSHANPALRHHEAIFFTALYLISVATGGHKPALESFGADQFEGDHPGERKQKMSYFNWWNAGLCAGLVFGVTLIVYVQDDVSWGTSYVVLTAAMGGGLAVFFAGRAFYRYRRPEGSPLTPLAQVVVAAVRKRNLPLPSNPAELHEVVPAGVSSSKRLLGHTSSLSFLDKAAIVQHKEEGGAATSAELSDPWRLATVTQVEELKLVVGVVPVWLTTQMFGLCVAQASTFFIKQGSIMNRKLTSHFELPPASVYSLAAIGMIISVTIYDRILVPFLRRATGNERGMSILQRIGIGMVFSSVAMGTAAMVERKRLDVAARGSAAISVFWLAPQFMILGFGDGFTLVGLQEYFYEQVPEGMRSLGIAFYLSVIGASNFISSLLITVVDKVTEKGGRSWFDRDLNKSRLDYFYWLLAVLNAVNLCAYVLVASRYSLHRRVASEESRQGDEPDYHQEL